MFFSTLIAAPILAGLVAGVWTGRRSIPWALAGVCAALGVAGAIVTAFNPDGRAENILFSIVAGVIGGGLVWLGLAFGRITRSAARHA